ncbi:MAG: F0F1 ATP synthase subunit delta [Alphaproteobacteria bacterium]
MQIDWWTLGLQVVNFLVLVWLLHRFLYRPVQAVIARRKAAAEAAMTEAAQVRAEGEAAKADYAARLAGLQDERRRMRDATHDEMAAEKAQVLAAAQAEAERLRAAGRDALAEERRAALHDTKGAVAGLAAGMAAALLRDLAPATPDAVFLARIEQALAAMPDSDRRRLQGELADDGFRVTVATAVPLDAPARARWTAALRRDLGADLAVGFDEDPALIGGAALHFPHTVIGCGWADQLEAARSALLAHAHAD